MGFGERLVEAGERHGRLCVGIDPHAALLEQWGVGDTVEGLRTFSRTCVEAFAGHVALVKPQVAFFERFGSKGFVVLEETLGALRASGTLVVADAKRGDIGSTMEGYARAWLGTGSPLEVDAVTLTPFLGVGSLDPAIDLAQAGGKGVFVMAANSNPEAERFQSQRIGGVSIAQQMVDACAAYNTGRGIGDVGVVVGATVASPPDLRALNAPVLMPGVGAQGASFADVDRIAGDRAGLFFPNVSRGVLREGPDVDKLRECAVALSRRP